MFEWICFLTGILCICATITFAIKSRHNTKQWTSIALFGVLFSTVMFVFPTVSPRWGESSLLDGIYRGLSSLLYSLKAIVGRQDLAQIEAFPFDGIIKYIYAFICYIMFFITPILTTAWLVSFLGDIGEKFRYLLHISKKAYVFSELNENALSIANGAKKQDKHAALVFCDTKKTDADLLTKARKLGGICLYKSCTDFHVGWFRESYNFYLISDNEDKNIQQVSKIIETNNKKKNAPKEDKIVVSAFSQSGTSIDIIESINQKNIKVRFIDHIALLCNQLIFEHPLYNISNGKKDISVLIIGCGRTGMQMLKTVSWYGQIEGYSLKIRVCDKDPLLKDCFFAQAPELDSEEYNIDFITADILSGNFESEIGKNLDATYVFIATGDDDLNLRTATRVRGVFRRNKGTFDLEPKILVRVRSDSKTSIIKDTPFLSERNITIFGNASDLFEGEIPFETKFEKLSLGVHLAYEDKLSLNPKTAEYKKACERFYCEEYNRRASMATALHIAAKLVACGVMRYNQCDLTDGIAKVFEDTKLRDENCIDSLAKSEHTRWNAFYRSEGYHSTTMDTVKLYAKKNNSHKDKLSKTHPCITDWDSLIALQNEYNALMNDNKDFQEYDYKIVRAIPDIIRFANK